MSFRPNPSFQAELEASIEYRRCLWAASARVAPIAEGMTHHAMLRSGHRRIEVIEQDGFVYLVNTNYCGHLEEFGSVNSPAYSPLRRGVRAAGYRLHES
jgi:hypothetical protein